MAYRNYAHYLLEKFEGNISFAIDVMLSSLLVNLNNPRRFESDLRVLEELELLKSS
jgi:hypothetical protein